MVVAVKIRSAEISSNLSVNTLDASTRFGRAFDRLGFGMRGYTQINDIRIDRLLKQNFIIAIVNNG